MAKEISVKLVCVQMRSGVEIWIEQAKAEKLQGVLKKITGSTFIDVGDEIVNSADIVGVFTPETMDATIRRKNGQWQCAQGTWHDRGEKCLCPPEKDKLRAEARSMAIKNCGKCENGFEKITENGVVTMRQHSCVTKAMAALDK